jgi:hypothetical protein
MSMGIERAGRVIGVLILAQMAIGILVNFVLTAPLFGSPGFLTSAASHGPQIAASVLLGLATGALSVGIAIVAFPHLRERSEAMALWFVALAVAGLSAAAVEQAHVMSMLSLSEAYGKAGAPQGDLFQGLRGVVAAARNWAHYVDLIVAGGTIFVFYAALYRFALVPRALAAFGIGAALLQVAAVAMPLFGDGVNFALLAPLGLSQLLLALWLVAKGLRAQPQPESGENET